MDNADEKKVQKRKRIVAFSSLAILILVIGFLTYFLAIRFCKIASSGVEFTDYIKGFGPFGIIVAIGLQIIQVFIALIPGEFIEVGMGYAYGWFGGALMCLCGVTIGSAFIFQLVKKYGIKFVELFVSTEKINALKIINDEQKLRRITFILFFIPGTPKDLMTYFIGLTRMTFSEFIAITIFARIPSIVSSTLGGNFIEDGKYINALVLFLITAVVSIGGIKIYDFILQRIRAKSNKLNNSDK